MWLRPALKTRYHAFSCSCAQTLIYWIVSQSTIVRLFSCKTERNVNQCNLTGSVFQTRERERVCADSTMHPLVIYMSIFLIFKQTSSKTVSKVPHRTRVSQTIIVLHRTKREREKEGERGRERERDWERGREREKGFRRGVRRYNAPSVFVKTINASKGKFFTFWVVT